MRWFSWVNEGAAYTFFLSAWKAQLGLLYTFFAHPWQRETGHAFDVAGELTHFQIL